MEEKLIKCDYPGCDYEGTEAQMRGHRMHHARQETQEVSKRNADRKKRVPLGAPRRKMSANNIPKNKVARWVNDWPGRVNNAIQGGYRLVMGDETTIGDETVDLNTDMGMAVSMVVGKNDDGTPLRAYLMVIDKDLYEQDQDEKQKEVDKIDNAIRKGKLDNQLGPHGYIPDSGISYNQGSNQ